MIISASSWVLGHLVSACFAGFLSDAIGRKKSLLIDTAVFFLGFGLLATGHKMTCLVLARILLGYPLVSQVFLCEILDTDRRGLGAAMYSILHSTGFFVVLFLGNYIALCMTSTSPHHRGLHPLETDGINPNVVGGSDICWNQFPPRVSRLAQ